MKAPSGYWHLLPAPDGFPEILPTDTSLTQANVSGFRWRTRWNVIQPTAVASYDWHYIDDAIDTCDANGKFIGISIEAGRGTPDWVYDTAPLLERFAFDPENEVANMPYPWQPEYLAKWQVFVNAFGDLYDSNPTVKYVIATGWMQATPNNVAKTADEETRLTAQALLDGYSTLREAMDFAAQSCFGFFIEAFPNTSVMMTDGGTWPSDGGQGSWRAEMRHYTYMTYPEHGGWMHAEARASVGPWPPPDPVEEQQWPHGYQAFSPFNNLNGIYNNNVPDPPPVPPQIAADFAGHNYSNNAQFLELYAADIGLNVNQAVWDSYLPLFVSWLEEGEGSTPISSPISVPISVPISISAEVSIPVPGDIVAAPTVRIVTCKTGTHARNIILGRKRPGAPIVVPAAPGPVEIITVVTPHEPSSGQATATWLSPEGSDPDELVYQAFVTGGPGTVTITSQVPYP